MNTDYSIRPPEDFCFNYEEQDVSFAIVTYTYNPETESFTRQIGDVEFTPEQKDFLNGKFEELAKTSEVINYDVLSDAGNRRFIGKLYDDYG